MANSFNDGLVERAYRDIAREAALDHIRWTFTPMLDISRDPRWGRCVEGPGEDPYLGARMAAAAVKGIQGKNLSDADSIAACANSKGRAWLRRVCYKRLGGYKAAYKSRCGGK